MTVDKKVLRSIKYATSFKCKCKKDDKGDLLDSCSCGRANLCDKSFEPETNVKKQFQKFYLETGGDFGSSWLKQRFGFQNNDDSDNVALHTVAAAERNYEMFKLRYPTKLREAGIKNSREFIKFMSDEKNLNFFFNGVAGAVVTDNGGMGSPHKSEEALKPHSEDNKPQDTAAKT